MDSAMLPSLRIGNTFTSKNENLGAKNHALAMVKPRNH